MSRGRMSMARHAALTPDRPEKPLPQGFYDDAATLAMPAADRNAKRAQEAERRQQQAAARGVARWAMLAGHGCTGLGCRSPQHAAGREVRDLLLEVLGL
jgi:hypothetical protein